MLHLGPDELAAHYRKAVRHLGRRDPALKKIMTRLVPASCNRPRPFFILTRSIISQHLYQSRQSDRRPPDLSSWERIS